MSENKKIISIYNEEVAKDIRSKVHKKVLRLLDIRGASVDRFKESFNEENISKIVLLDDYKFECTYEPKNFCTDCKQYNGLFKEEYRCYYNSYKKHISTPLSKEETLITKDPLEKNRDNHCKDYSPTLPKRFAEYLKGLRDAWRYIR